MDWIPAITTTVLLAGATWLARNWIRTRLAASIKHEFDSKLEKLRSELRSSEEAIRADLRAKEAEIAALRAGAMSSLANRLAVMDKRRLDAVDQVWAGVIDLSPAKAAAAWMSILKFEAAAEESSRNPQFRAMFEAIAVPIEKVSNELKHTAKARPHVSDMAWALFSAYQSIVLLSLMQLQMLKQGLNAPEIFKDSAVANLLTVALPHRAEYIAQHGRATFYLLLDELEAQLLKELRQILLGLDSDKAAVKQAAVILEEAEKVRAQAIPSSAKQ